MKLQNGCKWRMPSIVIPICCWLERHSLPLLSLCLLNTTGQDHQQAELTRRYSMTSCANLNSLIKLRSKPTACVPCHTTRQHYNYNISITCVKLSICLLTGSESWKNLRSQDGNQSQNLHHPRLTLLQLELVELYKGEQGYLWVLTTKNCMFQEHSKLLK